MAQTIERPPSARRTEMVRVAARLFSARGYHGTSMQDLADALGLQRGSLYAHIGSKEDLLYDVVLGGADRFLARAEEAADHTGPARARLETFLVGHVETVVEHLDAATVFLNEWRYLSPERRAVIAGLRDRYEEIVRRILADGIERGDLARETDVRFATTLILSAGNWVYTWYRPGGALSPDAIGRRFAGLIIDGLAHDGGGHP